MKSIITSHMAFHLRQVYPDPKNTTQSSIRSLSLRFNTSVVGNAGAPLHNMLSDSFDEIEAESNNIQFSNDPLAVVIHPRGNVGPSNDLFPDEESEHEAEGLLEYGKERSWD